MNSPDWQGENLIFLISQPRAGSTMLQKILGGHPEIHTLAEPWVMLYSCFGLKNRGCLAYYEAGGWAQRAMRVFIDAIGGEKVYDRSIREMGRVLYGSALQETGKRYFLDKTPRYYWIVEDLARIFPCAHFVILLRNPVAVLCSILRSWVSNPLTQLDAYRSDLIRAPEFLRRAIDRMGDRATVIRYEDLVTNPYAVVEDFLDRLGVTFDPGIIQYGLQTNGRMAFGDSVGIQEHTGPQPSHADRWIDDMSDPKTWRFARDYLDMLRRKGLLLPGYDDADLTAAVLRRKPAGAYWRSYPLAFAFRMGALARRVKDCARS